MIFFIQAVVAFIVVIGLLVTVHEFGHYWVAKRLGVKILCFSIGFGQPIWSKRWGSDNTEFVLAAIPLGGYVKMLDETEGEVGEADLSRAFNRQSLAVRSAIVLAGPLFNFFFAIVAYTLMYMVGTTGMKAIVGDVTPQSLADQAGFRSGYEILAVNDRPTLRWQNVIQATLPKLLDKESVVYTVQNERGSHYDLRLNLQSLSVDDFAEGRFFDTLGMHPWQPSVPAIISKVLPNSAAERAKLLPGDKIISLDEQPIKDWNAWASYINKHPDTLIHAEIERGDERVMLSLKPENVKGQGRMGVLYAATDYKIPDAYLVTERYSLGSAFLEAIGETWDMSILTLRLLGKMLILEVSPKNISGPVTIAEYAGRSAQVGIFEFLSFLGLISVSLGVMNLLPIPVLDGGHLFMYLIEWIKGNPVTEQMQFIFQRVGLAILFGLMGLAIFNDLGRYL